MEKQQEASITRGKKVFWLVAVIAAGFTLCTVMKTIVCGKTGQSCSC
jgi:hypothetical protein